MISLGRREKDQFKEEDLIDRHLDYDNNNNNKGYFICNEFSKYLSLSFIENYKYWYVNHK